MWWKERAGRVTFDGTGRGDIASSSLSAAADPPLVSPFVVIPLDKGI